MSRGRRWAARAGSVAIFVAFIVGWEVFIHVRDIKRFVMPPPSQVWRDFSAKPDVFIEYGWNTMKEALGGLVLGVILGALFAVAAHRWHPVGRSVKTYSAALMALPVFALVPLSNIFLGAEPKSRIFVVTLKVAPIMTVYLLNGLSSVDAGLDEMFRSISASRRKTVLGLHLPSTLPHLVSGLRVVGPMSFALAVIAEYFGGRLDTLGTFMKTSTTLLQLGDLWGAALMAFVFSALLYVVLAAVERSLLSWQPANRRDAR